MSSVIVVACSLAPLSLLLSSGDQVVQQSLSVCFLPKYYKNLKPIED